MKQRFNVTITIDSEDYAIIMNALQSRAARLREGPKLDHIGHVMTTIHEGWNAAIREDFRNAR